MPDSEIEKLLKRKLKDKGVPDESLNWGRFYLLATPEGVLVDVVLTDASQLPKAERAMEEASRELERENIDLLPTVRALWEVERVEPEFPAGELQKRLREGFFGLPFRVILKSGSKKQEVGVEIMPGAYTHLQPSGGWDDAKLRKFVKQDLEGWLSIGGAGYWDPVREPRRIVNSSLVPDSLSAQ
jgi:hypothetical protein